MKKYMMLWGVLLGLLYTKNVTQAQTVVDWTLLPVIMDNIKAPVFPEKTFNVLDYGATGDGVLLSTKAIQTAIDACHNAGGGKVLVPAGLYHTGAIILKSNVNLHIDVGATLKFSTDPDHYLPVVYTRFEGVECYNYSPFIYAFEEENIAVTGKGTLDGQGSKGPWYGWKESKDEDRLYEMGENNIPVDERVFGAGYKIRPNFIQPYRCKNVLIDSITILDSPMWEVHPVLCENVIISNLKINSHGPNNDGCNPESSKNVLIYKCIFNTGDDCIAIKSGRNNDGRRVNVPSENIVVQECLMKDGHGGVTMGSECSGNIRNVFIENCIFNSPNLDRALRVKTNAVRGGVIENIFMRNCTIEEVGNEVFQVDMQYEEGEHGDFIPVVRNIELENIIGNKCRRIFDFDCFAHSPVSDVRLVNCNFKNVKNNFLINVEGLQIYNSFFNGEKPLQPKPVSGYIHAEAYIAAQGWGWSNVLSDYSGDAYMEPMTEEGYIDWEISSNAARIDTVIWYYANKDVTAKVCDLYVNSEYSAELIFTPAPGWTMLKVPFVSKQGKNLIRLVSKDEDKVYIDKLSIKTGVPVVTEIDERRLDIFSLKCLPSRVDQFADIVVQLPNEEEIILEVISIEGVKVRPIYKGNCVAGRSVFSFDRRGISAGMYFLQLSMSKGLVIQKILLE